MCEWMNEGSFDSVEKRYLRTVYHNSCSGDDTVSAWRYHEVQRGEVKQNIQKRRRSLLWSIFKPLLETADGSRLSKHLMDKLTVKKSCHPLCLSYTAEVYSQVRLHVKCVTDAVFKSGSCFNHSDAGTTGVSLTGVMGWTTPSLFQRLCHIICFHFKFAK